MEVQPHGSPGLVQRLRERSCQLTHQRVVFPVAELALFGLLLRGSAPIKLKKGKDPDGGEPTVVFDNKEKAYLQRMAYEAVLEFNLGNENES